MYQKILFDKSNRIIPLYWKKFVDNAFDSVYTIDECLSEYGGKMSVTEYGDGFLTFETEEQFTFFVLRWS